MNDHVNTLLYINVPVSCRMWKESNSHLWCLWSSEDEKQHRWFELLSLQRVSRWKLNASGFWHEIYGLSVSDIPAERPEHREAIQSPPSSIRGVCWASALHEVFRETLSASALKAAGKSVCESLRVLNPLNPSTDALWVLASGIQREDWSRESDVRTEHFWFLNDSMNDSLVHDSRLNFLFIRFVFFSSVQSITHFRL